MVKKMISDFKELNKRQNYCKGCIRFYSKLVYLSNRGLCGECENIDRNSIWKKWNDELEKWEERKKGILKYV